MFEGVPNYPERVALLGGDRQAPGHDLLHRADRDPRADARGRRAGEAHLARSRCACSARVGEPINPEAWRWYYDVVGDSALPDRRHLVADRDRRHPDLAAARRDRPQARLGDAAVLRRAAGAGRCQRRAARRRRRRQPGAARFLAGPDAHRLRRPPALHRHLLQDLSGHVLHRRRLPPRRRRLLLDHRPRRRRDQRQRPPHRHRRSRERAGLASARWPRRRWSASRTTSRARASTPTSP